MRLVIDTNVLLSGLLWSGTPRLLFECVRSGKVDLLMSQVLMDEFAEVITRRKFTTILQRGSRTPEQICHELGQLAEMIVARPCCKRYRVILTMILFWPVQWRVWRI